MVVLKATINSNKLSAANQYWFLTPQTDHLFLYNLLTFPSHTDVFLLWLITHLICLILLSPSDERELGEEEGPSQELRHETQTEKPSQQQEKKEEREEAAEEEDEEVMDAEESHGAAGETESLPS